MTLSPLHRVALAVALSALAVALYCIIAVCVQRQERYECMKWQADAYGTQYAPWQFDQCLTYGIDI